MNFRTDLALERRELLTDREIPGVKSRVNQSGSVCVTAIEVQTEQGAQAIGKPVGSYITVEVPPFSADAELLDGRDRKSTRLNSSHSRKSRMPSSA